jgi:hypothetical protein
MTTESHVSTGVPEVRDELIRKTVEYAAQLQERIERGTVDQAIAAGQCRALWFVTSGLVGDDVSELLSQQAAAAGPGPIKRFFAGSGRVLLLAYLPDTAGYVLQDVSPADGSRKLLKSSKSDVGIREAEIAELVKGLVGKGFVAL